MATTLSSSPSSSPPPLSPRTRKRLSKKLSWALRHGLDKLRLTPRPDGYVALSSLLRVYRVPGLDVRAVREIVASCPKRRFALLTESNGDDDDVETLYIRANQGHSSGRASIDPSKLLTPILDPDDAPPICVHGTTRAAWRAIRTSGGLSPMTRDHIHFATGLPSSKESGVISGARSSSEVFVYVDVAAAVRAGVPFYRSANGVILTPGIKIQIEPSEAVAASSSEVADARKRGDRRLPFRFFEKVVARDGVVLWSRKEEEAADRA